MSGPHPTRQRTFDQRNRSSAVKLVLDTNVVIDWLVFEDPFLNPFRAGVLESRITIVTHQPAIDELRRVLSYPALKLKATRQAEVLLQYQARTIQPSGSDIQARQHMEPPAGFPRCRDPDDNHFLVLAWRSRADALVSRDRAVLTLRKRSRVCGFTILDVQEMIAIVDTAPSEPHENPT